MMKTSQDTVSLLNGTCPDTFASGALIKALFYWPVVSTKVFAVFHCQFWLLILSLFHL